MYTRTFGVLYACDQEIVPSVYFLPITWNGISPPGQALTDESNYM